VLRRFRIARSDGRLFCAQRTLRQLNMLVDYTSEFHCKTPEFRFVLWTERATAKLADPAANSVDPRVG